MSSRNPVSIAELIPAPRTGNRKWLILAAVLVFLTASTVAQAQATKPGTSNAPTQSPDKSLAGLLGDRVLDKFQAIWPDPPEAVAMLVDILKGSQLGPGEGWFKKATSQTRYDWAATRKRLDHDGDGRITIAEFGGSEADFARLDRNHDRVLDQADFDFSANALTPSPGAMLFYLADRDGNGKLTHEEVEGFFRAADSGGAGFLSLADLQESLSPPPRARRSSKSPSGPSRLTLIKGLFRQEIGSLQVGPALNAPAPDFTLKTVDGRQELTLSKLVGPKPVVLIFGNFTCGPFRTQAGNIEKLCRRYRDRATFVMVYVREAHPIDGWQLESNIRIGVSLPQPQSYDERVKVAQTCNTRLGLGMPMLVDSIDDSVGARYSGMPSRLYLINQRGLIAFKNGRGPFGFKPAELEQSLILLLRDEFLDLNSKSPDRSPADHSPKR